MTEQSQRRLLWTILAPVPVAVAVVVVVSIVHFA
jgi:hypothetical protein